MNSWSLCLMTAALYVSICDGDLVISDFGKDRHSLVTDDLKLLVEFDTKSDGIAGLYLKARKSGDGIVIYILHKEEIKTFTVSKDGKVSESGTLTINGKSEIYNFDVEPSGKFVVMSSGNELYFLSQEDKKLSKLLESDYVIGNVLIHPTKRHVYYTGCSINIYHNFLFVYDMDSKVNKQLQLPTCFDRIVLDSKENIVWALAYAGISMLNLTSGITESMFRGRYAELVIGHDNLLVKHIEQKENKQINSILKLSKKHQVHKQTSLKDYNIQPALSYFKVSTPVLFNIDEGLIEILDNQFAMTNDKIKLDINKKSIKSIRSFNDDQSTTFFWIHDSNGGVVEYVRINHKDRATIKRGTFKFQTEHGEALEDLTDFDVFEKEFYFPINDRLFKADIDYSKPEQSVKPHGKEYYGSFTALGIRKEQKKLVIFSCSDYVAENVELPLESERINYHALFPCPEKFLFDQEDNRLLVSTPTGLVNFRTQERENEREQIYSGRNIGNFVLDKEFVYFVSKIDGPSIYKVPKRRAVKLDHNLQFDEIGHATIAHVKEIEDDIIDVNGGNSEDGKDPGLASEMTSPEKIFLLLLVQFVLHLLP